MEIQKRPFSVRVADFARAVFWLVLLLIVLFVVLAQVLGGGRSSRLYKKLVYEKQIAQSVNAFQESLLLGSKFQIVATATRLGRRRYR